MWTTQCGVRCGALEFIAIDQHAQSVMPTNGRCRITLRSELKIKKESDLWTRSVPGCTVAGRRARLDRVAVWRWPH